jgi:hypothetical protein
MTKNVPCHSSRGFRRVIHNIPRPARSTVFLNVLFRNAEASPGELVLVLQCCDETLAIPGRYFSDDHHIRIVCSSPSPRLFWRSHFSHGRMPRTSSNGGYHGHGCKEGTLASLMEAANSRSEVAFPGGDPPHHVFRHRLLPQVTHADSRAQPFAPRHERLCLVQGCNQDIRVRLHAPSPPGISDVVEGILCLFVSSFS